MMGVCAEIEGFTTYTISPLCHRTCLVVSSKEFGGDGN